MRAVLKNSPNKLAPRGWDAEPNSMVKTEWVKNFTNPKNVQAAISVASAAGRPCNFKTTTTVSLAMSLAELEKLPRNNCEQRRPKNDINLFESGLLAVDMTSHLIARKQTQN